MNLEIWLIYLGTILVFMSTPGPSHILMISVSIGNGFKKSLATAAGDLSANAIQIVLAGLGLAVIIVSSRHGFSVVKWLGVAYLVWVGVRTIISSFRNSENASTSPGALAANLWLRGFLTSAANPKAVVFFAALFPQFIDSNEHLGMQILILGTTYIVVDCMFLVTYGLSSHWLAQTLKSRYKALIDRISGARLIAAAFLLGLRTNAEN